jgi:acetyl esterase/lipase
MLVCGDLDVLYTESVFMHLLLTDRKIPHEALFVTGASHEFNYYEDMGTFPYLRNILNFLDRTLKQVPAKPAPSRTTLVPDVFFRDDIVWAETPSGPLRLDLAIPKGYGPYPILVYFHEGNFNNGGKGLVHFKAKALAQMGYIVVVPEYRLADKAQFPAAVNDALGAVIWAKERVGRFNGDHSRVVVIGADAGAYLAAMTAFAYDRPGFSPTYKGNGMTDARPTAVALLGGAYRLDQLALGNGNEQEKTINPYSVRKFLGAEKGSSAGQLQSASLASYLDAKNPPPFFIMTGEDGRLYPESRWLQEQLDARRLEQVTYYLKGDRSQSQFDIETKRTDLPYARLMLDFLDAQTNNCGPMEGVCK